MPIGVARTSWLGEPQKAEHVKHAKLGGGCSLLPRPLFFFSRPHTKEKSGLCTRLGGLGRYAPELFLAGFNKPTFCHFWQLSKLPKLVTSKAAKTESTQLCHGIR